MNSQTSGSKDHRRVAPVYVVFTGELVIDAPIEKVWRHMIDYASWQNYSVRQHVSGEIGQEGEVVLLKKEEKEYTSEPYYARTIKIEAGRRIIWKTYRDTPDYFGIVDFRLEQAQGRTLFCTNNLYEFLVPYQHESELEAFRKERYRLTEAVFAVTHARLKKLAEQGA